MLLQPFVFSLYAAMCCQVSAYGYEGNATALNTTGTMTDLTGNVRTLVFRHVSISCFGSHVSDKCILNYVIDQATNGGFLSLADLLFLDDVSQSSVVKNYIETKFNAFFEAELPHLETLEKLLRTSGTRSSSPNYSKIWVY
jgi:hypothetical protein